MVESKFAETICERLRMPNRDVWKLRKQFNDIDIDNTNTITMAEFFYMINFKQCELSETILRLADPSGGQKRLTFDEFLCCACQFASFSEPELLEFVFSLYASDKHRGEMVEQDLFMLTQALMTMQTSFKGNIRQASQRFWLASSARTANKPAAEITYTLDDVRQLAIHNPVAFYPLLSLQRNVRRAVLGERYWANKVDENAQIDALVNYMEHHGGVAPPLSWREHIWAAVCWPRTTKAVRLRRQAEQKFYAR